MSQMVRDVMTRDPATLDAGQTVLEAARTMKDRGIGDVVVSDKGRVCGIVTDRDIVVRGIATGNAPSDMRLGDVCSADLTTVEPETDLEDAVRLMSEHALRRLPVVQDEQVVGIVSLGDLAVEQDRNSALGTISAAPSNS
jgi:CBS domain-containing protein